MTHRIEQVFTKTRQENRAALVTYLMGYDPDLQRSMDVLRALPGEGADIIELGMPFSDPSADGPVIEAAAGRALAAGGTVRKLLDMVVEFRRSNEATPLILMGYYNPVYHYGVENFVQDAVAAGVDGVILVDLPPEEEAEFTEFAMPAGLSLIKLTSPTTTPERAKVVLHHASGFVYYISVAGITGVKSAEVSDVTAMVQQLKQQTDLPIAVGFGIKTPEQAAAMADVADGIVVGSALVKLMGEGKPEEALALCRAMASALRG